MKTSGVILTHSIVMAVFLLGAPFAFSQDKNVGDYLGEYMGISAYSNGVYTDDPNVSTDVAPWQCVNYVRRFYGQTTSSPVFGLPFGSIGTAKMMFDYAEAWTDQFFAYSNSNSVPPLTGDILCFDGAGVGHVAIVTYVNLKTGKIGIIEQNWNRNSCFRDLNIAKNADKTYSVTFSSTQGYYIEGWVRAKKMVVGQCENDPKWDQVESQAVAEAYNLNSGLEKVGMPHDDGAGVYVHTWDPHGFLVQNFDSGSWGSCAIVMRSGWTKAYSLHGMFWWYFWYHNVPNGLPISEEYQDSVGNVYQDFETGISLKWDGVNAREVSTTGLRAQGITYEDSTFHTASLPGNGQTLQIGVYAMSPSSVQVNGSFITNASSYAVYEDHILVGYLNPDPLMLNLLLTGRTPGSTHIYQLVASDSQGITLATSREFSMTLPAVPTAGSFTLLLHATAISIDASWPAQSGAVSYDVAVDGTVVTNVITLSATINNVSAGTHTVTVTARDSSGATLAQGSGSVTVGQALPYIRVDVAPQTIGPNQTAVVQYTLVNPTSSAISTIRSQMVETEPSNWLTPTSNTFTGPGVVAAYSEQPLATITAASGSSYPLTSNASVAVYCEFDCPAIGLTLNSASGVANIAVVSFADLVASITPTTYQPDTTLWTDVTVGVSNQSNSIVDQTQLDLYESGTLIASLLVPVLQPRQTWQQVLSLPPHAAGTYPLSVVVDSTNAIDEIDETNNVAAGQLVVGPDAQAALDAIAAANAPPKTTPTDPTLVFLPDANSVVWEFNGAAGSTAQLSDVTGNSLLTLTPAGQPTAVSGSNGAADGAIHLSEAGCKYLSLPDNALNPSCPYTFEAVFRCSNRTQPQYLFQVYRDDGGYHGLVEYFVINSSNPQQSGAPRSFNGNGAPWSEIIGSADVLDGQWHYWADVNDGMPNGHHCYVDGVEVVLTENYGTSGPGLAQTQYCRIGGCSVDGTDDGYHFQGDIDAIRFSHVARSTQEIADEWAWITTNLNTLVGTSNTSGDTGSNPPPPSPPVTLPLLMSTNLVARYPFAGADLAGLLQEVVGTPSMVLSAIGTPTTNLGVLGAANGSILFDGSQYLSCGTNPLQLTGPYTVSFWMKSTNPNNEYVFQIHGSNGCWYGIVIYTDGASGCLRLFHGAGGTFYDLMSNASVCDGVWHFCTCVWDGSQMSMYVDGQLNAYRSAGAPLWSISTYGRIGGRSVSGGDDGYRFIGSLADLQIYDAAATSDEISTAYHAVKP